jgi:hypothetical protein
MKMVRMIIGAILLLQTILMAESCIVSVVFVQSETITKFQTTVGGTQWYTISETTWDPNMFDKCNAILLASSVSKKSISFEYNTTKLPDGSYDVSSLGIIGTPPDPSYCYSEDGSKQENTYLRDIIIFAQNPGYFRVSCTCPSQLLYVDRTGLSTNVSATMYDKIFAMYLSAIVQNKMIWASWVNWPYVWQTSIYK